MELLDYSSIAGGDGSSASRRNTGHFNTNEAIGSWRSLLLSTGQLGQSAFTFVFSAVQVKSALVAIGVTFKKTWTRTL